MIDCLRETELGILPASWRVAPMGDFLVEAQYGSSVKGTKEGRCPILRMTNQVNGRISTDKLQYVDVPEREMAKFLLERGDILFNRTNSFDLVGRTAIFDVPGSFVFASYLIRLRTHCDQLDPVFLNFYLNAEQTQSRLKSIASRAVSQSNISATRLRGFPIPVPPVSEQRKIAAVLGLVQQSIDQQERLIALTTELKKALLHKLFTEGLHGEPEKQTEIGPVPESWAVVRLDEVCTFLSGGTPSKKNPEFWRGSIPWVSPKDMKAPRLSDVADHISDAALEDGSSLASAGSVFVVIRGMILAKDVPVALAEVPMAFNQDMKAIIPGPRILSAFLLYALVAFKRNLFQKVGRSSHGTMTLMSSELAQFSIPLPDRKMQEEIATAIETVEHKHDAHRRKHATLTGLFRTLLHQLMTAQIRVHDLDLTELQVCLKG